MAKDRKLPKGFKPTCYDEPMRGKTHSVNTGSKLFPKSNKSSSKGNSKGKKY